MQKISKVFYFFGMAIIILGVITVFIEKNSIKPQQINEGNQKLSTTPNAVVFMHLGDVYFKDLKTEEATKISKTSAVGSPQFSPEGKFAIYTDLKHFAGGSPRYTLYLSDIEGRHEKSFEGGFNYGSSRVLWSDADRFLAVLIYRDEDWPEVFTEAHLYDTETKEDYILGRSSSEDSNPRGYKLVDFSCSTDVIETNKKLNKFCLDYLKLLATEDINESRYLTYEERDEVESAVIDRYGVKDGYKIYFSDLLKNGLVSIEFYSGIAQNPETKWEVGTGLGGQFFPGYDNGVTNTYTLLINPNTLEKVVELDQAAQAAYFFE